MTVTEEMVIAAGDVMMGHVNAPENAIYGAARLALEAALALSPDTKGEAQPVAWTPPQACDGKEQLAFEAWASKAHYRMYKHPLHYIFLDDQTHAARKGWNAALQYVRDQFSAPPSTDALKAENERLREALEPFALIAEGDIGDDETDTDFFQPMTRHNRAPRPTVGDFRRARAALAQGEA